MSKYKICGWMRVDFVTVVEAETEEAGRALVYDQSYEELFDKRYEVELHINKDIERLPDGSDDESGDIGRQSPAASDASQ